MTLIEKAKTSHKCIICHEYIKLGEAYLQSIENVGGGMAIVGMHANHIANNIKNLKDLGNGKIKIIEEICITSVKLVEEGSVISEAIKEAKKIHGWSSWL